MLQEKPQVRPSYDRATDTLYLSVSDQPGAATRIMGQDVVVDLAADGVPVGYEIQFASKNVAFMLRILSGERPDTRDVAWMEEGVDYSAEATDPGDKAARE